MLFPGEQEHQSMLISATAADYVEESVSEESEDEYEWDYMDEDFSDYDYQYMDVQGLNDEFLIQLLYRDVSLYESEYKEDDKYEP